ncbi:hypothetical protein T492DRAFT_833013 [Pavlovales sp. CCMP2436]|nr:hypothetical protein T492DRAFT_833013 [Pavlovales sp. CCMP2436]
MADRHTDTDTQQADVEQAQTGAQHAGALAGADASCELRSSVESIGIHSTGRNGIVTIAPAVSAAVSTALAAAQPAAQPATIATADNAGRNGIYDGGGGSENDVLGQWQTELESSFLTPDQHEVHRLVAWSLLNALMRSSKAAREALRAAAIATEAAATPLGGELGSAGAAGGGVAPLNIPPRLPPGPSQPLGRALPPTAIEVGTSWISTSTAEQHEHGVTERDANGR